MRILLIAGHGAGDPGACGYVIEADETRKVVNAVKSHFNGLNVVVDTYPTSRNAYADVKNGVCQVNFRNYDYVLEIHFNSASPAAYGTEIFVTTSEVGTGVEQAIVNGIAKLGFYNRGVKRENFLVIRTAKNAGTSSALLEVCFVSNQNDVNNYKKQVNNIAKAIVNGIASGFGITGQSKPTTVTPVQTTSSVVKYRVKTTAGKQLGGFNVLANAKAMAQSNKAIVYDANGKVLYNYSVQQTSTRYAENGTFKFTTAVQIRTQPQDGYETGLTYYPGETVVYHHVILNKNGYNWIEYLRGNGSTGYIKIKNVATGESYGYAY